MMDLQKARREFAMLIDRCACSRAAIRITEEEAKDLSKEGIKTPPTEPSCTPKRCYPELYNLLYPKGGFRQKSYLLRRKGKKK